MINVKNGLALLGLVMFANMSLLASPNPEKKYYRALISFGDSLSDVGTYRVSSIAAAGGGKYSVNFPGSKIWVERLAKEIDLNEPCAAMTGLDGSAFGTVAAIPHPGCFGYAQGGARVSNAIGISHAASLFPGSELGGLTKAVLNQIQQHMSLVGSFSEHDLVTVWAGHNDILAGLTSATPVDDLRQAARELIEYIKNLIIAKGAQHVLVLNMGDFRYTPLAQSLPPSISVIINDYITLFNQTLAAGLHDLKEVLLLDIYTKSQLWAENSESYGITNFSIPACNLEATLFPSSLLCGPSTLISEDTTGYFYADMIHPAPKGHEVIADYVIEELKRHHWLPPEGLR